MTGHEPLLAMRRAGRVPRCVWITDGDDVRARDWHNIPNAFDQYSHAAIALYAGDIPEALDFRCCIGLDVHIAGERGDVRAKRLHAALIDAGARRVVTSTYADGKVQDLFIHTEEKKIG